MIPFRPLLITSMTTLSRPSVSETKIRFATTCQQPFQDFEADLFGENHAFRLSAKVATNGNVIQLHKVCFLYITYVEESVQRVRE